MLRGGNLSNYISIEIIKLNLIKRNFYISLKEYIIAY
jgi:hypothetical protein